MNVSNHIVCDQLSPLEEICVVEFVKDPGGCKGVGVLCGEKGGCLVFEKI